MLEGLSGIQTAEAMGGEEARTRRALLYMLEDLQRDRAVIREARRQWIDTVDSLGAAIMVHDADSRIVRANKAYAELAGLESRDLIGRRYWDCFPRRDGPLAGCADGACGNGVGGREEFALPGGQIYTSRMYSLIVSGTSRHGLHVFEDVTEDRRRAEAARAHALRVASHSRALGIITASEALVAGEVEALAREITENVARACALARVNAWLFNADESELHCIDHFDAAAGSHSSGMRLAQGQFEKEFQALKSVPYVAADDALTDPRTAGYVEGYLEPNGIVSMLDVLVHYGGKHFGLLCLEHVGEPHHWEEDEIAFASQVANTIAIAISNRATREAERAARASELRFRTLFDTARDGVFVVGGDRRLVEVNRSFAAMFRCTPEQALELSPARWHAIYAAPGPESNAPPPAERGMFETRIERADGTAFEAQVSYNVAHWEESPLIFSVCRDVSERNRDERALVASAAELKSLSRRLAQSEEAVRRRVASDLHDRVGGAMTALNLNLSVLRGSLPKGADARLEEALALVGETTGVVRELMADLRPPLLDEYGVLAALRWHGEQFRKRTGLDVVVTAEAEPGRLAAEREISLFRVAQEALTNIVKHANARTARIVLGRVGDRVRMTVADDGDGFLPSASRGPGSAPTWGIVSMRERAESVGGHLRIESAPGQGTRVTVEIGGTP